MKKVKITNKLGLHARPVSVFCSKARSFKSDILIIKEGQKYNGKTPIRIMGACIDCNDEIIIKAVGPDAKEAEQTLVELLKSLNE